MSTAKKGRVDINAELKEGMIARCFLVLSREKRVEMSTAAITMTESISHIGTDRKAFAVVAWNDVVELESKFHQFMSIFYEEIKQTINQSIFRQGLLEERIRVLYTQGVMLYGPKMKKFGRAIYE